jgi:hypothetical protein
MSFHTIQPTPDLAAAHRRKANRVGPPAAAVPTSYPSLLRTAGFVDIEPHDETDEYRSTQLRWMAASDRHEAGMRRAMGDDAYDERLAMRRQTSAAIEDGLLSRFRYTAAR